MNEGFRDRLFLKQLFPSSPYLRILFASNSVSVSFEIPGFPIFPFNSAFELEIFGAYCFLIVPCQMQAIKANSWYQWFIFLLLN